MYGTHSMQPSDDFTMVCDTSRATKAIYVGPATGDAIPVMASSTGEVGVFYTGGQVLPVRTKTAVTATGQVVVYLY